VDAGKSAGYSNLWFYQDGHQRASSHSTANLSAKSFGMFQGAGFQIWGTGWNGQIHEKYYNAKTVEFSPRVAERLAKENHGSQEPTFSIWDGVGGSPHRGRVQSCLPIARRAGPNGHPGGNAADY
jgi:hypothetical protein